ncbi:MAG: hypothetical protein ABIE22_05560 [archaeon]
MADLVLGCNERGGYLVSVKGLDSSVAVSEDYPDLFGLVPGQLIALYFSALGKLNGGKIPYEQVKFIVDSYREGDESHLIDALFSVANFNHVEGEHERIQSWLPYLDEDTQRIFATERFPFLAGAFSLES